MAAESLGKAFKGRNTAKRKRRVAEVVDALAETGPARQTPTAAISSRGKGASREGFRKERLDIRV